MKNRKNIRLTALAVFGLPAVIFGASYASASPAGIASHPGFAAGGAIIAVADQAGEKAAERSESGEKLDHHKGERHKHHRAHGEMTPEEHKAHRAEMKEKYETRWQERLEEASPEEREKLIEQRKNWEERRQAIREELQSLPPEERKARMEELREEFQDRHEAAMEKRRVKFNERWQNATPEEQAQFCERVTQRCDQEGEASRACHVVENKCSEL